MPVPTRKVELGFDGNGPGNFFTLDSPTAGVLNGTQYVLGGAAYYDVTEYVKSISINRGKSRELDRFNAGSANIQFNNQNRFFDPTNTSSPFYGQIVPRREVRISCNYQPAGATTTRTNLITNPSLETNTTNYVGASGSTIARSTDFAYAGSYSLQVTVTAGGGTNRGLRINTVSRISVNPSLSYTFSIYGRNVNAVGTYAALVRYYDASGTFISTNIGTSSIIPSSWTRYHVTFTPPANAVTADFSFISTNVESTGAVFYADAALLEQSATLGDYFSGSTPNINTGGVTKTYAWSGTSDASTSTEVSTSAEFGVQFYGLVDDWNLDYNISGLSDASLTAFDGFSKLAGQALTAGTATVQLSGARINAVLSDSGVQWPTTARAIDAGGQTLQADVVATGTNVMQYINTIEQSEPGIFFIDKSGNATFRDRNRLYASSNAVVLSDDGTGIPYGDIKVNYGSELLYNQAEISRLNGGVAVADDLLSQQTYGVRSYEASDLLMNTDVALGELAIFLVNQYASPEYRFESLTVLMSKLSEAQQNSILGLEIGSICRIKFQPNKIGAVIDKYAQVIGIQNQMSIADHKVTLSFQTIDTAYFVLDDPAFGLLDYNSLGF